MNARFFAPDAREAGELVVLPEEEAQHLTRVLRLKTGAAVRVFNGRGSEFDAIVERASKTGVVVRVGPQRTVTSEPAVAITLAQAVLKGDKMDDVVRDAVMMGVAAIQPLVSGRCEVTLPALTRGRRRERWARIAVSSAKQCGRATVPEILEPRDFRDLMKDLAEGRCPRPGLMLVEPGASVAATSAHELGMVTTGQATLFVGPEGGWTSDEIEEASQICRSMTLGERTLRADAVAIVAIAALFAVWKAF